ncbi:hypothetical protein L6452_43871 [Arctium lappa]|uniref:Uncharacterized protein n=1 Tax=Arctium lappa TaxID=4217 RepID=A0ACB8XEX3_ARCLA|nr:hypothetical protein L6452_43871 [Arctium lappa]
MLMFLKENLNCATSANSSIVGTSGSSLALEIDLNEAPLPSPREVVCSGGCGFAAELHRCGSCGEMEGAMVVYGDCGRRFHVECLAVREEQREWMCFECLIECNNGRRLPRGGVGDGYGSGLFDMNASPPREDDGGEEDYFVNSNLVLVANFPKGCTGVERCGCLLKFSGEINSPLLLAIFRYSSAPCS